MPGPTPVTVALDDVDFAVAAFRDAEGWQVQELTHPQLASIDRLADALRRLPGDAGALAMVAVDDDYFVLVRVVGASVRVLLSDVDAAEESPLAEAVVEFLDDTGAPDVADDLADELISGDPDLLTDLGVSAADLLDILDDDDPYPDEALADIADRLGFGELFDDVVGLAAV